MRTFLIVAIGLVPFSISLNASTPTSPIGLASTEPLLKRKISISKRSTWIHDQFRNENDLKENRTVALSQRRHALIDQIEKLLRQPNLQNPKIPDNYIELKLRLTRFYLEDYYAYLDLSSKTPAYHRNAMARLNDADYIIQGLRSKFPGHKRMDEITYLYAIVLLDERQDERAMGVFREMIQKYPNSRYGIEARIQLGDYAFTLNRLKEAEEHFDAVLKSQTNIYRSYAMYKKAWCAYNTGRSDLSISLFSWIIDNDDRITEKGAIKLRREALNDVAFPLTDSDSTEKVLNFYGRLDKDAFRLGVETAALLWLEAGTFKNAVALWDHLILLYPSDRRNFGYDISATEALFKSAKREAAVARLLERLDAYLLPPKALMPKASMTPQEKEILKRWEETTRTYATYFHGVAERMNNQEHFGLAEKLYFAYHRHFGTEPEAVTMLVQLGHLYSKKGMSEKAAPIYLAAGRRATTEEKQLQYWDFALAEYVETISKSEKTEGQKVGAIKPILVAENLGNAEAKKVRPLSEREKQFAEIVGEYVKKFPKSNKRHLYSYQVAYLYYSHGNSDAAYPALKQVVEKFPAEKVAVDSAYYLLDIQNQKEAWGDLVKDARWILEQHLRDQNAEKNVFNILKAAELKRIAEMETDEEYADAAAGYMEFSRVYGKNDPALNEIAIYNASVNLRKCSETVKAVDVEEQFLKTYPKSRFRGEVFGRLAASYEAWGKLGESANYYERWSKESATLKAKEQTEALFQSALLYWGAGQNKQALRVLASVAEEKRTERPRAEKLMRDIYLSRGMTRQLIQMNQASIDEGRLPAHEAFLKLVENEELKYRGRNHLPESSIQTLMSYSQKYNRSIRQSKEAVDVQAKLNLLALKGLESEYRSIRIPRNEAKQAVALQRKIAVLKKLERELGKVAAMGSAEWGIAAMYRSAKLHSDFADEVGAVPLPAGITAELAAEYRSKVDQVFIKPIKEKASKFSERCMRESHSFGILSPWTAQCVSLARKLNAERFPHIRTLYLPALQLAKGESKFSGDVVLVRAKADESLTGQSVLSQSIYRNYSGDLANLDNPTHMPVSYEQALAEQDHIIQSANRGLAAAGTELSFDDLYALTLSNPTAAVTRIQSALRFSNDPEGLQNLLALAHLYGENYPAAKAIWSSMIEKAKNKGYLYNNLGVLHARMDREREAMGYFEAANKFGSDESAVNLGFLALKYHNGGMASDFFGRVTQDTPRVRVGRVAALLQQGKIDQAKEVISGLASSGDLYAALTASYYFVDFEKGYATAQGILDSYLANDPRFAHEPYFKKILEEVRKHQNVTAVTAAVTVTNEVAPQRAEAGIAAQQ